MKDKIKKEEIKVILAYLSVCVIWGSTYLAIRIAVSEFPPELFAGIRFTIAGLIVLIFAVAKGCEFPVSLKDVGKAALTGMLLLFGCNGLVMWAEQWIHSGITALLLSATPLFTAIIESFFLRNNRLNHFGWIYLILGFTGVAMLVLSGTGVGSVDVKGSLIVLVGSLLWASGLIYSKKVTPTGSIVTHIGIQMLAAGLGLSIIGIILGEVSRIRFSFRILEVMAYLVVFGSIVAYGSNMYVLKKWPASKAVTTAYINPVIAVILGALILDEPINIKIIFSMAITLGGVIMLQISKNTRFKN